MIDALGGRRDSPNWLSQAQLFVPDLRYSVQLLSDDET